jgi:hypothetical protein
MSNLENSENAERLGQEVEARIKSKELDPAVVDFACDPKTGLALKPYEIPWTDFNEAIIMEDEVIGLKSRGESPNLVLGMELTTFKECLPDKNSPREARTNPNPRRLRLVKIFNPFNPRDKFGIGKVLLFNGEGLEEVKISNLRFFSSKVD